MQIYPVANAHHHTMIFMYFIDYMNEGFMHWSIDVTWDTSEWTNSLYSNVLPDQIAMVIWWFWALLLTHALDTCFWCHIYSVDIFTIQWLQTLWTWAGILPLVFLAYV